MAGERRRRPCGLRLAMKAPPVGWYRARLSSEPSTVPAFALDPCRGWGRHPLARIRAQKAPVVSPVGAGADYRRPHGVSTRLVHAGKGSGDATGHRRKAIGNRRAGNGPPSRRSAMGRATARGKKERACWSLTGGRHGQLEYGLCSRDQAEARRRPWRFVGVRPGGIEVVPVQSG